MHELSLSMNTVDNVVEQAKKQGFHRVTRVTLAIGTLSCIEPHALARRQQILICNTRDDCRRR